MHAKYEVCISYGSKVMAKVYVFFATDEVRDRRNLGAPEFHSRGKKIFN